MALHTLTDDGHMGWTCGCGQERTVHISHEQVEHPIQNEMETVQIEPPTVDENGLMHFHLGQRPTGRKIVYHGTIALPLCECGIRTFLKVQFTEEELRAPNMLDPMTGQPTSSYVIAQRHMALAEQMKAAGKVPLEESEHVTYGHGDAETAQG